MKHILYFVVFVLVGCASSPDEPDYFEDAPDRAKTSSSAEILFKKVPVPSEKTPTGKKFIVDDEMASRSLSKETVGKIGAVVRRKMKEWGFEEATRRRHAHVEVHLISDRVSLVPEDVRNMMDEKSSLKKGGTFSYEEKHVVDGKTVYYRKTSDDHVARFAIVLQGNEYGKRPVPYGSLTFNSPIREWTGHENKLVGLVEKEFNGVTGRPPVRDLKMKGDPGCIPRFGYEQEKSKVIKVYDGSPAQAAGFKLGDIILSIDSKETQDGSVETDIYENRIKVPVKIKRGEQIIRTQIQAKLMCD